MTTALTKDALAVPAKAGELFSELLRKTQHAPAALAVLQQHPQAALMALQAGDQALGLAPRQSADVLEIILDQIPQKELSDAANTARQAQMLREYMTTARLGELLQARMGLDSSLVYLVSKDVAITALLDEIMSCIKGDDEAVSEDDGSEDDGDTISLSHGSVDESEGLLEVRQPEALRRLYVWGVIFKDRSDYADLLEVEVCNSRLRDHLLIALWDRADCPSRLSAIRDSYAELKLDPDVDGDRLEQLLSDADALPEFTLLGLKDAMIEHREAQVPEVVTPMAQAQRAADDVAEGLNF